VAAAAHEIKATNLEVAKPHTQKTVVLAAAWVKETLSIMYLSDLVRQNKAIVEVSLGLIRWASTLILKTVAVAVAVLVHQVEMLPNQMQVVQVALVLPRQLLEPPLLVRVAVVQPMAALVVLAGQVAAALEQGATADLLMVMQEPLTQVVAAVAEKQAQTAALAS
jgi:hypothetical protein